MSACGSNGLGPKTWIDLPLNGTSATLGPLTLMAHSSDSSGVKRIEFYVNGEEITSLSTDGNRLESRRYEWEPLESGEYIIQARGINGNGEKGSFATARITIIGEISDFPPPATAQVITPISPSITPTGYITATVHPTVTAPTPTDTHTPTFTFTPEADVIEPPVIEVDTTDPEILSVNANPDPIYHEVCGTSYDLIVRLTVNATDNVAIDYVGGTWSVGDESENYVLDHVGGSQYQKDFGPFTTLGPLYLYGSAEDTSGNWTFYETQVMIKNCIE
jgi:hypothetical protein